MNNFLGKIFDRNDSSRERKLKLIFVLNIEKVSGP